MPKTVPKCDAKCKAKRRPTEAEYDEAENDVAKSYAPEIVACRKCGWPRVIGYCCTYCGTSNP